MATQAHAAAAASENARRDADSIDDPQEAAFFRRGCCCFWILSRRSENWERISASETESHAAESSGRSWWGRGVDVLKKVREWSELAAGPRWKTFIRRFNRAARPKAGGKFQYDPLSYALNFDEGQNNLFEDERVFRDFSSRYAAIPAHGNGQLN